MIPLEDAKNITKIWEHKNYHKAIFGKKHRIYIPLEKRKSDTPTKNQRNVPQEIKDILKEKDYFVFNYPLGIAKKYREERYMKIGKFLKKHPVAKQKFDNDPNRDMSRRIKKQKMLIVISKHPYDIYGASTNRRWTSCIQWPSGDYSHVLKQEVKYKSMIAYLIFENDKNIEAPIARIMIRPHKNIDRDKDSVYYLPGTVYGTWNNNYSSDFLYSVSNWITKKFGTPFELFKDIGALYNETDTDHFLEGNGKYFGGKISTPEDILNFLNMVVKYRTERKLTYMSLRDFFNDLIRVMASKNYFSCYDKSALKNTTSKDIFKIIKIFDDAYPAIKRNNPYYHRIIEIDEFCEALEKNGHNLKEFKRKRNGHKWKNLQIS